jgi:rhodanese-related sulfurtransferase
MMHGAPEVDVAHLPDPLPTELVVLDVREPGEWNAGHIDGSLHIPLMQLVQRVAEVPTGGPVLVVCRVGARSAQAAAFLGAQGVNATNLTGGLVEWEAAHRPMVSETGQPPFVY